MARKRFYRFVQQAAHGGARVLSRYPAALILAWLIAAAASARLELGGSPGWSQLFSSLQQAALPGVALGMAATALAVGRTRPAAWMAIGQATAAFMMAIFAVLLFWVYDAWPAVVTVRLVAITVLALLGYHLILSRPELDLGYDEIWFITLRSGMIAVLYGAVLLSGLSLLVFAAENLLSLSLGAQIYRHLVVWSLWVGFAVFLGCMPDFTPEDPGDRLERGRQQPVFFQLLLQYVVIPLLALMALVLLIWSVRTLVRGVWPPFARVTAIVSAYSLIGAAAAIFTASHRRALTIWFRRVFPYTSMVFLTFQTATIAIEIAHKGLRTGSYIAIAVSLYAWAAAIVLLLKPPERQRWTGWIAMGILWFAVLPGIGYIDLPAYTQTNRLESTLIRNGMLAGDQIVPAQAGISPADQARITTAVAYLYNQEQQARRPGWLTGSLPDLSRFEPVFGFAYTDPAREPAQPPARHTLYLTRAQGSLPLAAYDQAVSIGDLWGQPAPVSIQGKQGTYELRLSGFTRNGTPRVRVSHDGHPLPEPDLLSRLRALAEKYPADGRTQTAQHDDMLLPLESEGVRLLLVLRSVEAEITEAGIPDRWFIQLDGLYFAD